MPTPDGRTTDAPPAEPGATEPNATEPRVDESATDATGHFTLQSTVSGQLVADISTSATNTANGKAAASHMILRASVAQIADQGAGNVVISPMSSEVQRLVEANGTDYKTEKANLATRLSGPGVGVYASQPTVAAADVLGDVNKLSGAGQAAVLYEDNALANRYASRVQRLYVYSWTGGGQFDAGLTNASGLVTRPAYDVVKQQIS